MTCYDKRLGLKLEVQSKQEAFVWLIVADILVGVRDQWTRTLVSADMLGVIFDSK